MSSFNVFPYGYYQSRYNSEKNQTEWFKTSDSPGMTMRQYYLGQILIGLAHNPATMLDPETHIDYAVKLADLAYRQEQSYTG